jgi:hypothetical protein
MQYLEYLKKWQLAYPKARLFIEYEATRDRFVFGVLGFDDKSAAFEARFFLEPKELEPNKDEEQHALIVREAIRAMQWKTKKDLGLPDDLRTPDGYLAHPDL